VCRPPSVEFWRYLSVLTDRLDPAGDLARTFEANVTTKWLAPCATPTGVRLAMQEAGCFGPAQAEALGVVASVWRATCFEPRPDDDPLPAVEIRVVRKREKQRMRKKQNVR
jgi:hypothetical protein